MSTLCFDPDTLDSLTINNVIANMTDKELVDVLSSIDKDKEVTTLIKCNRESLDKIFRVKKENVKLIVTESDVSEVDPEIKRIMDLFFEFQSKENVTLDCILKVTNEMTKLSDMLKEDNERCKTDISNLESAYEKMRENLFMYEEDLEEDSLKVCKEKMESCEGLIRLRYKTMESNIESIKGFELLVKTITDNMEIDNF